MKTLLVPRVHNHVTKSTQFNFYQMDYVSVGTVRPRYASPHSHPPNWIQTNLATKRRDQTVASLNHDKLKVPRTLATPLSIKHLVAFTLQLLLSDSVLRSVAYDVYDCEE